jgi:hypothetical protein
MDAKNILGLILAAHRIARKRPDLRRMGRHAKDSLWNKIV